MISNTSRTPAAFVLGMTCNGLSVARSLGRKGVRVLAVDSYIDRPGLRSRYCKVIRAPTHIIDDAAPWLKFLLKLAAQERIKPVLFPTEDAYILFIAEHREALSEAFDFNIAPSDIVEASVSKLGTYQLACKCGIPTPWTYLVRTMSDYEQIAEQITFPCALKPSHAHIWLKKYRPEKLLVMQHPEELEKHLAKLAPLNIEVVLQEIIPGDDSHVYVFPAYVDRRGEVRGHAMLKKIRQQPVDFGVGAFNISVDEPQLREVAFKLIERSGFTGMASTEYKRDPRDGQFKLIDINPRTCMIGELAIASGIDLPYLYYRDVVGDACIPSTSPAVGVKWWCFELDLASFVEYRRRKQLTFLQWLSSLRGKKVYAYYASDDVMPFLGASRKFMVRLARYVLRLITFGQLGSPVATRS